MLAKENIALRKLSNDLGDSDFSEKNHILKLEERIRELTSKNIELDKTIYELRFVKEKSCGESEKEEKEKRAREKQSLVDRNKHLEDRVKTLESGTSGEKEWYTGKTSHHMYLRQARTNTPKEVKFSERNFKKTSYPSEKYRGIQAQRICYFCGYNGHFQRDCSKFKKMKDKHYNPASIFSPPTQTPKVPHSYKKKSSLNNKFTESSRQPTNRRRYNYGFKRESQVVNLYDYTNDQCHKGIYQNVPQTTHRKGSSKAISANYAEPYYPLYSEERKVHCPRHPREAKLFWVEKH